VGDPAVTSTPAVNQPASSATVNIKITYSVIAVQKNNLEQIVSDELNKKVDKNKEKLSDKDVLSGLTVTVQNQQANSPNATLNLTKDTTAVPIIDENTVKEALKGKKENQIKAFLSEYPGVKDVDVKFSPFWVSSAPGKTSKIKLVEQQVSSDPESGQ
jgi:CBS-domain-containing membrane protein